MASRLPRTILTLRAALPRVQVIPARNFVTLPATRPTTLRATTPFIGRFKSTERSAWAKEPIISYEELKPITQQPNDVCSSTEISTTWAVVEAGTSEKSRRHCPETRHQSEGRISGTEGKV